MRSSLDSLMTPYALSPASRITAVRMNRREFFGEGVVWITQGPISGMSDRSGRKRRDLFRGSDIVARSCDY